jgi:TRAP-type C4-dicarboxylate transport system substrate-binding protein
LRLSHQLPESDARHRAAKVLAAELRKRVPDLVVRIHPNASLVSDPPKQYEAMLEGKIDMAIYPMGYASAKFPELSIVTLPGIPANAEVAGVLKGSEFEEQLQRLCEEKGFRILTWWWLDGGMASRSRAVTAPGTIKDLGARSGGGNDFNAMLQAAGARIVAMPLSEVRSALETGKLDVAQSSFEAFVSYRFYETAQVRHGRRLQHADGVYASADLQDGLGQPQGDGEGAHRRRPLRRPTSTRGQPARSPGERGRDSSPRRA